MCTHSTIPPTQHHFAAHKHKHKNRPQLQGNTYLPFTRPPKHTTAATAEEAIADPSSENSQNEKRCFGEPRTL